ncbi:MAG: mechanosensitive ion channel family protein [Dehalococcoidia bacterium]|nr:mechanosensitive ion channel family protein [Dehalococcoidia bacterium]
MFEPDLASELVYALVILLFFGLLSFASIFLLKRVINKLTQSTESTLDDQLVNSLKRPIFFVIIGQGIFIAVDSMDSLLEYQNYINNLWMTFNVAISLLILRRAFDSFITWYEAEYIFNPSFTGSSKLQIFINRSNLPIIKRIVNVISWLALLLIVLSSLGISVSPLLAGLGIGGFAFALAVQPILTNVIASSYMLSDSSVRVNDFIEIEGGPTGWVEDIGWRATRLRTFDNNLIMMPNSHLADATVTNFDAVDSPMDVKVETGVAYESDLNQVEEICIDELQKIIVEIDNAVPDRPPLFLFTEFGDSNINFLVKIRANNRRSVGSLKHIVIKRIHQRLNDEGITINYPARRLLINKEDASGLN